MKTLKSALYLASSSPRRKQLLSQAGFRFKVVEAGISEKILEDETPKELVLRLSSEKAEAAMSKAPKDLNKQSLFIGADTIVVDGMSILGKPKNKKDAIKMLQTLSGKTHSVLTGYTLLERSYYGSTRKPQAMYYALSRLVETKVTFRALSDLEIQAYVLSKEPMDKAGAYGIQGLASVFISKIEGSYSNVVGLPMTEIVKDLQEDFSIFPLWIQKK